MKKLKINPKFVAGILSGIVFASAGRFAYGVHEKNINTCELESTPIEKILEIDEVKNNTQLDEEIKLGNTDIIEKEKQLRNQIEELTYDYLKENPASYKSDLLFAKQIYKDFVLDIIDTVGVTSVSDALGIEPVGIELRAPEFNGRDPISFDKGEVLYYGDIYKTEVYDIKSKYLEKLVELKEKIESDEYKIDNAHDLEKNYDKVINTVNDVLMTGLVRQNDDLKEKYSKKYFKDKFK